MKEIGIGVVIGVAACLAITCVTVERGAVQVGPDSIQTPATQRPTEGTQTTPTQGPQYKPAWWTDEALWIGAAAFMGNLAVVWDRRRFHKRNGNA